ncbi:Response regulator receiver domain-containing protein [Devosia lucknowensis]|uniref:Response regulator receiver domain-containing protein n=1 Tax=Devosia lucknowensis TaxID=1096929 RepID=A0A1Y6G9W0_9HYPH|nr:response regulator [Devosia lucknowensis]SMQ85498.1 Response regulator receiver domain-containing protein [Devosia lucknowensis]
MSDDYTPYALVADDDPLIRMDASDILQDAGFRVHEAANYGQAMAILVAAYDSIQLLFTDVQMPPGEKNGFDLAQQCSQNWPHINILVASGMIEPEADDLPDGAVFVRKPFSADVVYDHLQKVLPDGAKPEPLKRRSA